VEVQADQINVQEFHQMMFWMLEGKGHRKGEYVGGCERMSDYMDVVKG